MLTMLKALILPVVILFIYGSHQIALANDSDDIDDGKFTKLFCNPGKTDSTIVAKINDCEAKYRNAVSSELKDLDIKIDNTCRKECSAKAGDMSAYTKVDLTKGDLKFRLIEECDPGYLDCITKLNETDAKFRADVKRMDEIEDQKEKDKIDKCIMDAVKQRS